MIDIYYDLKCMQMIYMSGISILILRLIICLKKVQDIFNDLETCSAGKNEFGHRC